MNTDYKPRRMEADILAVHGIEGTRLPDRVRDLSTQTAQLLSMRGLYILGQDWIQEGDDYTLLEVNRYPGLDVFKYTHKFDEDQTMDFLAKSIIQSLSRQ